MRAGCHICDILPNPVPIGLPIIWQSMGRYNVAYYTAEPQREIFMGRYYSRSEGGQHSGMISPNLTSYGLREVNTQAHTRRHPYLLLVLYVRDLRKCFGQLFCCCAMCGQSTTFTVEGGQHSGMISPNPTSYGLGEVNTQAHYAAEPNSLSLV